MASPKPRRTLMLDYLPINHLLRSSASRSLCHRNFCAEVETSYPFYLGLKPQATHLAYLRHAFRQSIHSAATPP